MSGSTMHVSGFFDRLRLVADLDYSDTEQDQAYEAALARIDACVERVRRMGRGMASTRRWCATPLASGWGICALGWVRRGRAWWMGTRRSGGPGTR